MARLFVVMGVAGSGKSLIGALVADQIGGTYIDGDDYHPKSNIEKMSSGVPLTDEDRWPWLAMVASELSAIGGTGLIGCSALKKAYREFIQKKATEPVTFIYLSGSKKLIADRMAKRDGHFMPTALLDSQFDALEIPSQDENVIAVEIDSTPETIAAEIGKQIKLLLNNQ